MEEAKYMVSIGQSDRKNVDNLDLTENPGWLPLCYGRNIFTELRAETKSGNCKGMVGW